MIYIVSGLPRSGTSMMMKMLEAGGLSVLVDADNPSTDANPGGAYAYEKTKRPPYDWMAEAEEKAVKVTAHFLYLLPLEYQYKIIYMERTPAEVVISQSKRPFYHFHDDAEVVRHSDAAKQWASKQDNLSVLLVDYNKLVFDPLDSCVSIADFLGVELNTAKMSKVPNSKLYRNRTP
jgi:LPS sulfotransferase NodH